MTDVTETPDSYRVTAEELRQIIEGVERVNAEIKDRQEDRAEIFSGAKAKGYDIARLRDMIKLRAMDPDKRAEMEAVNAMYSEALGL